MHNVARTRSSCFRARHSRPGIVLYSPEYSVNNGTRVSGHFPSVPLAKKRPLSVGGRLFGTPAAEIQIYAARLRLLPNRERRFSTTSFNLELVHKLTLQSSSTSNVELSKRSQCFDAPVRAYHQLQADNCQNRRIRVPTGTQSKAIPSKHPASHPYAPLPTNVC